MSADTALWAKLQAAGLTRGEMPAAPDANTPWYVRVMLGVAGLIGGAFLVGFVVLGMKFLENSPAAAAILGLVLIGGAYAMFRGSATSDFAAMFALAVSIAGQTLFVWGAHEMFFRDSNAAMWALVAAIEAFLAAYMPNYLHRAGSAYAAAIAFAFALGSVGVGFIAPGIVAAVFAWLWLSEARLAREHSRVTPAAYGFTLAFIQLEATALFGRTALLDMKLDASLPFWLLRASEAIVAVVLVLVVIVLVRREGLRLSDKRALAAVVAAIAIGAVSLKAPGIAGGLAIAILGFAAGNAVLRGLGVAGLLFYVGAYYYLTELTLLEKSITLAVTGLVLLGARAVVLKRALPDA